MDLKDIFHSIRDASFQSCERLWLCLRLAEIIERDPTDGFSFSLCPKQAAHLFTSQSQFYLWTTRKRTTLTA